MSDNPEDKNYGMSYRCKKCEQLLIELKHTEVRLKRMENIQSDHWEKLKKTRADLTAKRSEIAGLTMKLINLPQAVEEGKLAKDKRITGLEAENKRLKIKLNCFICHHSFTNPPLGQYGTCDKCGNDEHTVKQALKIKQ